jgi:hypothetical protein
MGAFLLAWHGAQGAAFHHTYMCNYIVAGTAVPQRATQHNKSKACTMWWALCSILQQSNTEVLDITLRSSLLHDICMLAQPVMIAN